MKPNLQNNLTSPWLPYIVTAIGILLFLGSWHFFLKYLFDAPSHFFTFGISLSILAGFTVRLVQVTSARNQFLAIQDRLHMEETKQKLEKALLQGQKLQAMGTLAGGIAHDFNNILYAITGYAELVKEDLDKNSVPYKNLEKVLEGCKRGQEVVARILSFSRRQQQNFAPINIKDTLEGVLALLKPTIPASVTLDFQPSDETNVIMGNQTQLHQVLMNLVNNAIDAMDGEGQVTIKLSTISSTDEIFSQFPKVITGKYCKLEVRDTGHGMDPTTISRIFEPFYTTKEVGKGTGLGLAIVHTIIKEHQGEIMVESQLGHGTTFTILLPEFTGEQ